MRLFSAVSLLVLTIVSFASVSAQCPPPATLGTVNFCSPAPSSTVPSPVTISATGAPLSGQTIVSMKLYLDNVLQTSVNTSTINVSLPIAAGKHTLAVNFWTTAGGSATVVHDAFTVGTATGVSLNVTPDTATVAPGGAQQFTSTVTGVTNKTVTWWVDGVKGGNATVGTVSIFGLYTAPTAPGSHRVTAVLNADSTKRDSSLITVAGTPGPSVTVTPGSVHMQIDTQQQFDALVQNSTSGVDWFVDDISGGSTTTGTISATGLYTAPGTAGTHTIAAKLATDSSVFGTSVATVTTAAPPALQGVFTYGYDNGRTGANNDETILTPANVSAASSFGAKGTWSVDATIQTQPLYVAGVVIGGVKHNVLYVATENDSVYGLDADVPGKVLWKRNFLTTTSTIGKGFTGGRTALGSSVGITGTPVIDPATNRLYVLTRNTEGTAQVWRIRCISIINGADAVAPVVVSGSVSGTGAGNDGTGHVPFDSLTQNQRAALLLQNGVVYVAFASFSDHDPYHGWVFAFDAGTLKNLGFFNDSINGGGGGIWMSGAGPSADAAGNIFITTGNGRPDATPLFDPPTDSPNSVMKIKLNAGIFTIVDYFAPFNSNCLTHHDMDMASAAATLIPDKVLGHDALVTASKEGRAYLIDRNDMGQFQPTSDSQILDWKLFNAKGACGAAPFNGDSSWRVYGAPAYWNGFVYFGSVFGPLRQYDVTTGKLVLKALSTHTFPASGQTGRGPMVVVSANGNTNGIVWSVEDDLAGLGWLRAYDATNVAKQLYQVNYGSGTHFVAPTVINGNVYVTGHGKVYRYGLLH